MTAQPPSVRFIFDHALDLSSDSERQAFIESACTGAPESRQKVEALLRAHSQASSFLESPPTAVIGDDADEASRPISEGPGTKIGPYKLLQQIGEGGFGVVYMAEQQSPVRRKVALKIIKPGMDTKEVIARFESERQALALMDHANIAKVLDAGATESGRPYFVMELVKGIPITKFCDDNHLPPEERLTLFVQVCNALQHAHQKGIIHRDLKPSNVMVTMRDGCPVPKVIDFGVAKATSQTLTERTLFTAYGQMIGTPAYMSPEQAEMSCLDIDTRSDIYSLGVLLYELLTGTTPFEAKRLRESGFAEMQRIIRDEEPPKPSTRVSTLQGPALTSLSQQHGIDERRLRQHLRGELDWIVMKSLDKDREQRYESAISLARDIRRYLSDEPVHACPPTALYRFRKYAKKHRTSLTTAILLAASVLLGAAVSVWQAVRATQAEAQANANEVQAQASSQEAKEKAEEATSQRDEAQRQRDQVKAINEKLQATHADLRDTLYAAHMNLAHNCWEDSGLNRMRGFLNQYRPKAGESDLRGFEWHYLNRLSNSEIRTLYAHAKMATEAVFSPDGKRIASAGWDNTVSVWDAQTGRKLLTVTGPNDKVNGVAFSPDGKRLAAESKVWDAFTGEELVTLQAPGQIMVFSPDGKRLAGASYRTAKIWDAHTGQELVTLRGAPRQISSVAFSPDGKHLASSSYDGTGKIWEARSGQELHTFQWHSGVAHRVIFSPDGQRLASCGADQTVKLWEVATGNEVLTLKGHSDDIFCVAFSPDGQYLASSSMDQTVKLWDAQTGNELLTLKGHGNFVRSVVFSPDGKRLLSASGDGTVKVWDAQTIQGGKTFKGGTDRVWGIAFSSDGKRLASATYDNSVKVWDPQTGQDFQVLRGHTAKVWSVAFCPDGKRLASASQDKTVKVWDAHSGEELSTLIGHSGDVVTVVFSPDGRWLSSASADKTVKVWDLHTYQEILTLKGAVPPNFGQAKTMGLAFSPDGKHLAANAEGHLRICDVRSGQELLTIMDRSEVLGLSFSPDGKRLARAGARVKIWDTQTGQEVQELRGHSLSINSAAFSSDGRRLATTSDDKTVKVWNAKTGQETLTLRGQRGRVFHAAFSPDGHQLAVNGADGTVKIYDATPLPEESMKP